MPLEGNFWNGSVVGFAMSEGVSEILRSDKPPSFKKRRAEDLDSGGSTGQSGCRYKGCRKSRNEENSTWGTHRPFCSKIHRDFFMADLFDLIRNGGAHMTEEPSGICKLAGCSSELSVCDPYDFCSYDHVVKYRGDMMEQWSIEGRLCKYHLCFHHVHVDETSKKPSDYCRLKHRFAAAAAERKMVTDARTCGGKDRVEHRQLGVSEEAHQQLLQAKIEDRRGYHDIVPGDRTLENCLRCLLINPEDFEKADPSGNFCRVKSLDFHPFEDVTGFVPKWYVHFIDSKVGKLRRTKQGCGWKRKGPKYKNKSTYKPLINEYFTYELTEGLKVKGDIKDNHCDGCLVEYRQYEEDRKAGKLKTAETRWKMLQYYLPDDLVKEVTGGKLPSQIPVISKVFQDKDGLPVWPPLPLKKETRAREVLSHVNEKGMTRNISFIASPPGEGVPPGREISQKAHSKEFEGSDGFLQDLTADESNTPATGVTIPEVRFPKDRAMINSNRPIAALGAGLPPLNCDDSCPSDASLGEGLPLLNWDDIFPDMFDHSKVGGDNMQRWLPDGNSW